MQSRDFLLANRRDSARAVAGFRWPELNEFNWALDYFDRIAAVTHTPALHIVDENGEEHLRSFAQMSADSNRVANYFRSLGVRKGDRLMVMLGNEVALWETALAAMKLGNHHARDGTADGSRPRRSNRPRARDPRYREPHE